MSSCLINQPSLHTKGVLMKMVNPYLIHQPSPHSQRVFTYRVNPSFILQAFSPLSMGLNEQDQSSPHPPAFSPRSNGHDQGQPLPIVWLNLHSQRVLTNRINPHLIVQPSLNTQRVLTNRINTHLNRQPSPTLKGS